MLCISINPQEITRTEKKENVLVTGIWFGVGTPNIKSFKPFIDEIRSINENMMNVNEKQIEVIPIICAVDSITRSKLQSITQFNGSYGCYICLHPGDNKFEGALSNNKKYTTMKIFIN
jgi:hypothetical protein